MKKKNNYELKMLTLSQISVILLCIGLLCTKILKLSSEIKEHEKLLSYVKIKEETKKLNAYNECLTKKYSNEENTENIERKISEINKYIESNYNASIVYENVNSGFSFKYNENTIYYGASLIKLVEAEYIFDKAISGEIDINETLKYMPKYISDYSQGMSKRKIGEEISLKDLVSYSIMYSDNTAHFMLSDYIGKSNLISCGKSLGAKNILNGGDTFGNQSANDTNIYLNHAYEIINSNEEYGKLLKEYMTNTYNNSLYLTSEPDNNVAHKYGLYGYYYHDIGIIYEEYPYYISILTTCGYGNYKKIVNDIHKKINELHHLFYEERKQSCHLKIYES